VNRLNWDWTKLNVYVLDDSHRESIRELAERYAFHYIAREDRGVMKKAGNIRNAFKQTSGEYIVIFDADFCPRPEFLFETVPYFIVDPNTALVQTPQFFDVHKSMGWVERGAGSIQELFYRLIQVNRDHWQGSICVGTNAVYRRAALEPFGGTYPIQHSEDVHTGFSLVRSGWRLRYVPIVLAKGTCPEDMDAFFNQQYRWAMGSTSLLFNKALFWNTKLKPMTRMSYLSGMFYYSATGMGLLLTSLPGLCMVWLAPERIFYYNYLFSLPSFIFGVIIMGAWNRAPYGLAAVRARYVSYCAHLFAIVDRTFSRAMEWLPTGSVRRTSKPYRTAIIITTLAPAIAGAIGCVVNMGSVYNYHFYPYIFFTLFYTCLHLSCLIKPRYNSSNAQTTTVNNDGDSVMRHSRSA
jgi:cellulose synthase/poly-beta-1,6-N-acetylglucosamine synthase-like glycosyltransferase